MVRRHRAPVAVLVSPDPMANAGALHIGDAARAGLPSPANTVSACHVRLPSRPRNGSRRLRPRPSPPVLPSPSSGRTVPARRHSRSFSAVCTIPQPARSKSTVPIVRDFDCSGWRKQLAAVFQDFLRLSFRFATTSRPEARRTAVVRRALDRQRGADLARLDTSAGPRL